MSGKRYCKGEDCGVALLGSLELSQGRCGSCQRKVNSRPKPTSIPPAVSPRLHAEVRALGFADVETYRAFRALEREVICFRLVAVLMLALIIAMAFA